jgi:hypothetical protein
MALVPSLCHAVTTQFISGTACNRNAGGFVRVYTSGYSEFIAADGRWFDCALAEARKIIPWHCLGTGAHGGSGGPQFYTSPMKLKHAKQYMIDQGHTLLYVDEPNATLFFKPKQ